MVEAENDSIYLFIPTFHLIDIQNHGHISKGIFQQLLETGLATVIWNKMIHPCHQKLVALSAVSLQGSVIILQDHPSHDPHHFCRVPPFPSSESAPLQSGCSELFLMTAHTQSPVSRHGQTVGTALTPPCESLHRWHQFPELTSSSFFIFGAVSLKIWLR